MMFLAIKFYIFFFKVLGLSLGCTFITFISAKATFLIFLQLTLNKTENIVGYKLYINFKKE